ncbi:MAG: hypothetical protein M3023_05220 [Pseudomonadota bacterium]|nr:hypothetical protein [Pseudomonadota bacterium]
MKLVSYLIGNESRAAIDVSGRVVDPAPLLQRFPSVSRRGAIHRFRPRKRAASDIAVNG